MKKDYGTEPPKDDETMTNAPTDTRRHLDTNGKRPSVDGKHDYDAVTRVHCSRIWLTQDWGFQYWEFWTADGKVGLHAADHKGELARASTVYPLLAMQPQQRDTVDLDITYQWQRGTATKAARRKLIEILPKAAPAPDKPARKVNRFGGFMAWYGETCQTHHVPEEQQDAIRRAAASLLVGREVKSFTELPDDVDLEALKGKVNLVLIERGFIKTPQKPLEAVPNDSSAVVGQKPASSEPVAYSDTKASQTMTEQDIRQKYIIRLKGKEYLQVAGRILLFRLKYPLGSISTEVITVNEQGALVKAMIMTDDGKLVATGHAFAQIADSKNYSGRVIEKAETAAIGRALAHAGFGTDAAGEDIDEMDDGDSPAHMADSPVGKPESRKASEPTSDITEQEAREWVAHQREMGIKDEDMTTALGVETLSLLNFRKNYINIDHLTATFDKWIEGELGKESKAKGQRKPAA